MSTQTYEKSSMARSVGKVSAATAFSRILGLIREQVIAWYFGAGLATDAFVAAFRIPNLLRDMFAEGALSSAFVPVFKTSLVETSEKEAFHLANIVMTKLVLITGLIVVIGMITTPAIVYVMAKGFASEPGKFALTVDLTRIMFVYLLLVSVAALAMGILNSMGQFGIPALSSSMFNIGSILPVVLFFNLLDQPIYLLAIGVVIGGIAQVAIQWPSLYRRGYRFKFTIDFINPEFRRMVSLFAPMIIGLSAGRINILISTLFASFLGQGALSYLNFAFRLMHFPMGVFAVALGTVTLPRITELTARKDSAGLENAFQQSMNLNLLLVIPSAFYLALFGHEIVNLIFGWGRFTEADSLNTSMALLHYSYGLCAFATVRVLTPFYYAQSDAKLPMIFSIISVVVNTALYYPLMKILSFAGLAAATSIGGLVNCALLLMYLPKRGVTINWSQLTLNAVKLFVVSLISFGAAKFALDGMFPDERNVMFRLLAVVIPGIIGLVLFVVFAFILRVDMMSEIRYRLFKR